MKTPIKSWLCSIPALLAFGEATGGHLLAADFHVATAQELQSAFTLAAANGANDTIYLTNGYYVGNFNFNSAETNSLTLQAEPGITNTDVNVDGGGTGRAISLSCSTNAAITVRGLTFLRNCGDDVNAAMRIATGAGADVLTEDCQFISPTNTLGMGLQLASGNNAVVRRCIAIGRGNAGSGISISGIKGSVTVQNCTVTTNITGLYIAGASVVTITNCTFNGNLGSGASCSGTTVTLTDNTFTGNTAVGSGVATGGGALCGGTTVTLINNAFTSNSSMGGGGGALCGGTTVTLSGNTFRGNRVYSSGGGGASCTGIVTMTNNSFIGNSCATYGGGLMCGGPVMALTNNIFMGNSTSGDGGGGWCNSSTVMMSCNTFMGNSASGDGGGLCNTGGGTGTTLSGNSFQFNTGGGLYVYSRTVRLLDNLIVRNSQTNSGSKGGGVWIRATTSLDMINNTVADNTAAGGGGGVAFQVDGVTEILRVYNNIIWGNTATGNGADVHLAGTGSRKEFFNNNAHGIYGVWDIAANNLDLAPMFFDPVNGDYHLRAASPCINVGTNAAGLLPATDLDGSPRIAGVNVDLGCFEFSTGIFHPADVNGDWVISAAEYNAYAAAWKSNQVWVVNPVVITDHWITRAGYLLQKGGAYHNDSSAQPTCWKPGL